MTQLLAHPELGTAGDFTRNTAATPIGSLDGGVFRPHTAIAATLVGPSADWTLVLAESGLFLLDDSLATRARLTLDGEELEGDLSASPDGSRFAVGANEGAAHGVDVREWPSLTRVRFVPTAVVSRIRWSHDGTELAACSRDGASTTLVTVATGATEVYPSTAKVNDATFIGKGALAYGNDDDTTLALQRRTNAPWFDHLASIHHSPIPSARRRSISASRR